MQNKPNKLFHNIEEKYSAPEEMMRSSHIEKINTFFEEVQKGFREAVIPSHLPAPSRVEYMKNKEASKKVGADKLAKMEILKRILNKKFHQMSPQEKRILMDKMGFGGKPSKIVKGKKYSIVHGSNVSPDHLYSLYSYKKSKPEYEIGDGMTFIYDRLDKKLIATSDNPRDEHWRISERFKIDGDRDAADQVHGRIVEIGNDVDWNSEITIPSGINMSLWTNVSESELNDIIKLLPNLLKPTVIHLPDSEIIDLNPEKETSTKNLRTTKSLKDFEDILDTDDDPFDSDEMEQAQRDLEDELRGMNI